MTQEKEPKKNYKSSDFILTYDSTSMYQKLDINKEINHIFTFDTHHMALTVMDSQLMLDIMQQLLRRNMKLVAIEFANDDNQAFEITKLSKEIAQAYNNCEQYLATSMLSVLIHIYKYEIDNITLHDKTLGTVTLNWEGELHVETPVAQMPNYVIDAIDKTIIDITPHSVNY